MSDTAKTFSAASGGSGWSTVSNALSSSDANAAAVLAAGASESTKLALTQTSGTVPTGEAIEGITVEGHFGTHASGAPARGIETDYRLAFALTKDGVNPVGDVKYLDIFGALTSTVAVSLGAVNDTWGATFTVAEINASTFGLLMWRPATGADGSINVEDSGLARRVDWATMSVRHNAAGGSIAMAERDAVRQQIIYGGEVTPGTAVDATKRLLGAIINPTIEAEFKQHRPQGMKFAQKNMLVKEHSRSPVTGIPTYDELGVILASVIGSPATNTVGSKQVHVFDFKNRAAQPPKTYTIVYGEEASRAHRITSGVFSGVGVRFTRDEAVLSGSFFGNKIEDGVTWDTVAPGVNEVQTITLGTISGGTFKLEVLGYVTAAITWSATPATLATNIQTAINTALATAYGASAVAVTGTGPFTVTFSGTGVAKEDIPTMRVYDNSLAGAAPTCVVVEGTHGSFTEMDLVPILPEHVSIYINSTYADHVAKNGKLTRATLASWNIDGRHNPVFYLNSADVGIKLAEGEAEGSAEIMVQADSNGMALLSGARAGTRYFIRIEASGPEIASGVPHLFVLEGACEVGAVGEFGNDQGVYMLTMTLNFVEDPDSGLVWKLTLENAVTSY